METALSLAFMVFALGFFMYNMHYIHQSADKIYQRNLNEAREFGFETSKLRKEIIHDPKKKKK